MALRVERQRKFVDTMSQVENSHIPFPDEPPLVYPDAETWKELTAQRKKRNTAPRTFSKSSARPRKKTQEALKQPTTIEFVETPIEGTSSIISRTCTTSRSSWTPRP